MVSAASASDDRWMSVVLSIDRRRLRRVPPTAYFVTSAVFHYLGPSLAVLLFAHLSALGVAWLRIVTAAVVLGAWRRPRRLLLRAGWSERRLLFGLGAVLATMNATFYLAVDRLPLATVGAIEFLGPILLAVIGLRAPRNLAALVLAVAGVAVLIDVRIAGAPLGFLFAFANCAGFVLYVVLGHRVARVGGGGIDRLAAAMVIAAVVVSPLGLGNGMRAFAHPAWLLWGVGVGVCSSVIPYVCDQLAMARLPRATFALLLALLPATAMVMGLVVLRQVPTARDLAGVGLVVAGVVLHRPE
jgi:inner membrane transporter RhtA